MLGSNDASKSVLLIVICLVLLSCGGGGGSDASDVVGTPPAAQTTTVSGTVQAPDGQIASNHPRGILQQISNFITPSVCASITGLSPALDGTLVQLIRLSGSGASSTVLASTTTSGGRYSFNLTGLGLEFSNDLAILVANGAVTMRAFVTGPNVDLDPVSEASVRLVLNQIAVSPGATLSQFTLTELRDIAGVVNQLVTVNGLAAGLNIETTVNAIISAVTTDAGLATFLTAVAGSGQTTEGPGDIGNYFPLAEGTTWTFQGTHSRTGLPTVNFTSSTTVRGTKPVGGVITTVLAGTNSLDSGSAGEAYYLKDSRGVLIYGNDDVRDKLTPKLVPYRAILFPLNVGFNSEVVNKKGIDLGEDFDFDGKNDTADVLAQVTVEKFEPVTVPKGTFSNAAKVVQKVTLTVLSSAGLGSETLLSTQTSWFAPGTGPVKHRTIFELGGGGTTETITEELLDVVLAKQIALATNDLIYDSNTKKIYASVPGNPGSITPIDPFTGTIGASISVGSEPMKLALSDNGQYLYVGLDGEGAVQRVDLTTGTAGPKFSLGSDSFFGPYYVEDLEVLPGSPQSVAVSRQYKGVSPRHAGVAIYDNGVQRSNVTPGHTGSNAIAFSALSTKLYGYNRETTEFGFRRMAVDASGVTVLDVFTSFMGDLISGSVEIIFDGGFIYTTSGRIIDPEARTIVGTFSLPATVVTAVKPDTTVGRVFFLESTVLPETWRIRAFDRVTRGELGSVDIPGVSGTVNSLTRWGTDGLAFRSSGGQVFLVQSPILIP